MWISLLALTICLLGLCADYARSGFLIILNPFSWMLLLFLFYFSMPSVFSEQINFYYDWGIDTDDMLYARLLVLCMSIFFALLLCVFNSKNLSLREEVQTRQPIFLLLIFFLVLAYLLWVLNIKLNGGIFETAFLYDAEQAKDPYKLKNVAYLLVPVSIYLYFHYRRLLVFLPNLLIVVLDMLHGSRTTALISLVPIIICLAYVNRRIYAFPMMVVFVLLIIIGIVRSDNVVQNVPWYINAIGEFRETYIALPLFISNPDYVGNGNFLGYVSSLLVGLAQPIRAEILATFDFPGRVIAINVGRGYGLGSNFIIEPMYYGYSFLVFSNIVLVSFLIFIYRCLRRLNVSEALILVSFFIIFIRLIVREGVSLNIGLFAFICIFYWLAIYFFSTIRVGKPRIHCVRSN